MDENYMLELEKERNTNIEIGNTGKIDEYFSVSSVKFILMSLGTLGLYNLYWQHRNWKLIKAHHSLNIMPFWRAFFAPIWAFSLFDYIYNSASDHGIKTHIPAALLALTYLIIGVLWRLPDPYWLAAFLAATPLIIVNSVATKINKKNPSFKQNNTIKIWQWPIVIPVILFISIICYIAIMGESIEEFTFKNTLKHELIYKCDKEEACISAVKTQIKPCMDKSNFNHFIKHQDDELESNRFTKEFYECIVDEDGDAYFKAE